MIKIKVLHTPRLTRKAIEIRIRLLFISEKCGKMTLKIKILQSSLMALLIILVGCMEKVKIPFRLVVKIMVSTLVWTRNQALRAWF